MAIFILLVSLELHLEYFLSDSLLIHIKINNNDCQTLNNEKNLQKIKLNSI
jgi:hypothetical protein